MQFMAETAVAVAVALAAVLSGLVCSGISETSKWAVAAVAVALIAVVSMRVVQWAEDMKNAVQTSAMKLNYMERRMDSAEGRFNDMVRHCAEVLSQFNSAAGASWLRRSLRMEWQSCVSVSFKQGVTMSAMPVLWKIVLSAAAKSALMSAAEHGAGEVKKVKANIQYMKTLEFCSLYSSSAEAEAEKISASHNWSVLHDIALSFMKDWAVEDVEAELQEFLEHQLSLQQEIC